MTKDQLENMTRDELIALVTELSSRADDDKRTISRLMNAYRLLGKQGEQWAAGMAETLQAELNASRRESGEHTARGPVAAWPQVTDESGNVDDYEPPASEHDPESTRDPLPARSLTRWWPAIQESSNTLSDYVQAGVITPLQGFLLHVWGLEEVALAGPKGHTVPDAPPNKYKRNVPLLVQYARRQARDPEWRRLLGADIRIVRNLNARRLVRYVTQAQAAIDAYEAQKELRKV